MKNSKQLDFSRMAQEVKREPQVLVKTVLLIIVMSLFFYKSLIGALVILPFGILYMKKEIRKNHKRKKQEMARQFREFLLSMTANLQAGYAIENAVAECRPDMVSLFGENAMIIVELDYILKGIHNQIPVEELFLAFGKRTGVQEIEDFVAVFAIAKRTGGDLISILRSTCDIISAKIEVRNDIYMQIASKQFEQNIMSLMPFIIVLYISITSKGFFDGMYGNLKGILVMSLCLILYVSSYFWSQKILDIQV